jgi:hypothetical protein
MSFASLCYSLAVKTARWLALDAQALRVLLWLSRAIPPGHFRELLQSAGRDRVFVFLNTTNGYCEYQFK